ncbi:MAG: YkgJ family cysteine cluster protein [Candidatus Bathyarchaeota archaeon]|nr:YkgJ family cysteine cluster protein [Candidatus Bathyarchaeota archaeon]
MQCLRCGACCKETEMLLANSDIKRLEKKGYSKTFFVQFDSEGYAKLRNHRGYCVFYDNGKKRCRVYRERPLGCRLYPLIYFEEKGIDVDTLCPARNKWSKEQIAKKGKKAIKLIEKIDNEAKQRRTTTFL